jgi:recombination protein RecR
VVQDPGDIVAIEKAGCYRGRYHALMGVLSPMHGEGVKDLRLGELMSRVKEEGFKEVILALGMDVESEATAGYVAELMKAHRVKVTKTASGIPVGSGIRYSDALTLARSIKGRQEM